MLRDADCAIIERIKNGCPNDFEMLVKRYDHKLQPIVMPCAQNLQDQQDIIQEIWMYAFQNLASLRDHDKFPHWLCVIARNRCFKYLRERKNFRNVISDFQIESEVPLEDEHLKQVKNHRIQKAMENLSKSLRRTIAMYYFTGYSCNQVSLMMDVPVGTVKRRLSDARKKLKNIFKAYSEYPTERALRLRSLIIAAPICTTL